MPRRLSDSAKEKREKKMNRRIEQGKDLPAGIKHSVIEGIYRINWDERELGIVKNKDFGYKIRILGRAIIRAYTVYS